MVLVTTPPHPASNARRMLLSDSVGGAEESRNGFGKRMPVKVVDRSTLMAASPQMRMDPKRVAPGGVVSNWLVAPCTLAEPWLPFGDLAVHIATVDHRTRHPDHPATSMKAHRHVALILAALSLLACLFSVPTSAAAQEPELNVVASVTERLRVVGEAEWQDGKEGTEVELHYAFAEWTFSDKLKHVRSDGGP